MPAKVFKLDLSKALAPIELTSTDPEHGAVTLDTSTYSITPRTFAQRTLEETAGVCNTFIDNYTHTDTCGNIVHQVSRFGINSAVLDATKIRPATGSPIQKLPDVAPSTKGGSGTASSPGVDVATHKAEAQKQVTQYEIDVVTKAIAHLNFPGQTAKTALVDIFERDSSGNIATAKDASGTIIMTAAGLPRPATHTVVLFAQEVKCQGVSQGIKYLVIDPSNASFSHILAGASDDIRLCFNKKLQIYKPSTSVGPKPDQWRDCIDVAVKLAFSMEENIRIGIFNPVVREDARGHTGEIDFNSLKESAPIKEVTNQSEMYKKIPDEVSQHATRLKQSSDVKVAKKVTTYLKALKNVLDALDAKADTMDSYHTLELFAQKLTTVTTASTMSDFVGKCDSFLLDSGKITDTTAVMQMLGVELHSVDQL